jgi:selenium metabolism protein YedF
MSEKIDLRGLTCPEPVIRTKKLFDNPSTTNVEALVDDDVCVNNLQRLARSLSAQFKVEKADGYFAVSLQRGEKENKAATSMAPTDHVHPQSVGAGVATVPGAVGTVILLSKDHLGEGDAEFSKTLINLFLQTVFDSGHRPRAILLMNSGVRLMAKTSQALKVLEDFRKDDVEVLACGLCVDFYGVKEDVPKEQITNMFAICEYLFAADRIIQP